MERLKNKTYSIGFLFEQTRATCARFPGAVLSALLATGLAIWYIDLKVALFDARPVFSALLGIPLFLSLSLYREVRGLNKTWQRAVELIFGATLLIVYDRLVRTDATTSFYFSYAQLSLALHLLASFLGAPHDSNENGFWQLNKVIFLRILMAILNSSVLFVGIAICLATVHELLGVDIPAVRYGQLWFVCAIAMQTIYFLAGLPRPLSALTSETAYPKGLRIFVQNLLIPLVSLYMAILYLYMGKILLARQWPSGHVAWLVAVLSVLGVFNLLLLEPERTKNENRWIARYARAYYALVLPLLIMLFLALRLRVSQYGVTEPRYFLGALGLLLAGLSLYFLFSRKKSIRVVPVSLFFLAGLTSVGPWSAYQVAEKSQKSIARAFMAAHGLLKDGKPSPAPHGLSNDEEGHLGAIFDYLVQSHGIESVDEFFPALTARPKLNQPEDSYDQTASMRFATVSALMHSLGLSGRYEWQPVEEHQYVAANKAWHPVAAAGYERVLIFDSGLAKEAAADGAGPNQKDELTVRLDTQTSMLRFVRRDSDLLRIPLAAIAQRLRERDARPPERTRPQDEDFTAGPFVSEDGKTRAVLLIKSMTLAVREGKTSVEALSAVILFR